MLDGYGISATPHDPLKELPKDGRYWWLRWVDDYQFPHLDTRSPSVTAYLSPLSARSMQEIRRGDLRKILRDNTEEVRPVHLMTGTVPLLRLGSVFKDQRCVAELPSQTFRLSLDLASTPPIPLQVGASWPRRPQDYPAKFNYRVLNQFEYPCSLNIRDSECIVVLSDNKQFIIPNHVIFRSFYAPCTELALAFTSGPWDSTQERAVVTGETKVRPDGSWQIELQTRIHDQFRSLVACLTLDPYAASCAREIHAGFLRKPAGHIHAKIPLSVDGIQVDVAAVLLDERVNKFLVLDFLAVEWPYSHRKIWHSRQNSGDKGKTVTPIDKPAPFSNMKHRPPRNNDDRPDVNRSDEDPTRSTPPVNYNLPMFRWIGGSPEEKIQKEQSHQYQGDQKNPSEEGPSDTASGNTTGGASTTRRGDFTGQPHRPTEKRIQQLIELLARLKHDKRITDWSVVSPHSQREPNESIEYFYLPVAILDELGHHRSPAWRFFSRTDKRLRRVLICQIQVEESVTYWLEIECRPSENGYLSLLFSLGDTQLEEAIEGLLYLALSHQGIWPDPGDIISLVNIVAVVKWRHVHPKQKDGKRDYTKLHDTSAMNAIKSACSRRRDSADEGS